MPGDASNFWPNPIRHVAGKKHLAIPGAGRISLADAFRLKFAPDSIEAVGCGSASRTRHDPEFVMSIEYPPLEQRARAAELQGDPHADHVPPLRQDNALPANESPHRETSDIVLLLEENARLRKLAVQLSNLLGDLPKCGA
jgi:hypothetical protein